MLLDLVGWFFVIALAPMAAGLAWPQSAAAVRRLASAVRRSSASASKV